MAELPTGTVTFLFTDIEGSTRVIQDVGDSRYAQALADHGRILREVFEAGQGYVIETQGDAFLVSFHRARDAVLVAVAGQRALAAHAWPDSAKLQVRMGVHSGEPAPAGHGYVGLDVHRVARICATGYGGQILVSQATRHLVGDDLAEDIGFQNLGEHRLKDLTLPLRLYQVIVPDLPSDFPPPRSLNVVPNNLPIQLTTFIGREHEMVEVVHLLSTSRLLTLTGPGGGGKTRLALQGAAEALAEYSDGVWLVELATLSDPAFVPQAVATVLSVREQPGRSHTERLLEYFKDKKLLLILDNCEHVIGACAALAEELLRASPGLRILGTSREALRIQGEVVYAVPSLSLPSRHHFSMDDLKRSEAGRLFIERASLARPGFALQDGDSELLAQVCRRLDGNPLAIELAASRVKVLSVRQIATRLDDMFHLLTEGGRTTLPRHQTLQAAIDWSYDLLTEQEKILFRRLSVFAGGWTLAAAEDVCTGDGIRVGSVLDLLAHLVEKSLVIADPQVWEPRYRMLETIREYSRAKLAQSGDARRVHRGHLDWFLSLAEKAEPELRGQHQLEWLNRLDGEHDNFRVALKTSLAGAGAEESLRLAGALARLWYRRGHLIEGRMWLEAVLARSEASTPLARAKALSGAGRLATRLSDYEAARAFDEESLRIFREMGDHRSTSESLHALARVAEVRGDYTAARPLYEESLEIFRELGDRRGIAVALIDLGRVVHMLGEIALGQSLLEQSLAISRELDERLLTGATLHALGWAWKDRADYVTAWSLLEESVAILQQLGDEGYAALSVSGLAAIACSRGKYEESRRLYEESLRVFGEVAGRARSAESLQGLGDVMCALGDLTTAGSYYERSQAIYKDLKHKWGCAEGLRGLGWVALRRGDHESALAFLKESLRLSEEVGNKRSAGSALCALGRLALLGGEYRHAACCYRDALTLFHRVEEKQGVAGCLEGLAAVAFGSRQLEHAARIYGAASALRDMIGAPLPPADRSEHEESLADLRKVAGASQFDHGWSEGQVMTLEQSFECAMSVEGTIAGPHTPQHSPPAELKGGV